MPFGKESRVLVAHSEVWMRGVRCAAEARVPKRNSCISETEIRIGRLWRTKEAAYVGFLPAKPRLDDSHVESQLQDPSWQKPAPQKGKDWRKWRGY